MRLAFLVLVGCDGECLESDPACKPERRHDDGWPRCELYVSWNDCREIGGCDRCESSNGAEWFECEGWTSNGHEPIGSQEAEMWCRCGGGQGC